MNDIRRTQDHRISLERETSKLEDARDLTSNIRKHSYRHRIPFGKSQGASPGVRGMGGPQKLEAGEPWGLGTFEDLDMFSHQVFKILMPGLEVGNVRGEDNGHLCPLCEHDSNAGKYVHSAPA